MGDYLICDTEGRPVGGSVKISPQEILVNQEAIVDFRPHTDRQIIDLVIDGCGVHEEFQVDSSKHVWHGYLMSPYQSGIALKPTQTGVITVDIHQIYWVVGDAKGEIKVTSEISGPLGIWKFPVLNRFFKWLARR